MANEEIISELRSMITSIIDEDRVDSVVGCFEDVISRYYFRKLEEVEEIKCANSDVLTEYLSTKKVEGCAVGTVNNYRYILTAFFTKCDRPLGEITAQDIREFLMGYKAERNVSDGSLDKYREFIAWFFTWCHAEGKIPKNPAFNLKPIRHEQKKRKAMTRLEFEIMRDSCENIRERAIVDFLYSTAFRVSELCNAKISDVDFQERTVNTVGKGRKERPSYINDRCYMTLKQYLAEREDDSEYLFVNVNKPHGRCSTTSIERLIKKIQSRTGKQISFKVTPHIVRHTTATHAYENGMPIAEISTLLGHAKIETTMRYAHVSNSEVAYSHRKHVV